MNEKGGDSFSPPFSFKNIIKMRVLYYVRNK